ncbi:MAG: 16S rRNA (adenine(1518)-N(6)/adenine(1519)-N(6))-dimethyltransferase RsmA [Oligoflexia bacterium]|nr:16S rRNA (adenine(1518)-N(6)/adenine(1519)-N(6))-dimethyltransferase RsmA [Oligoflexia bacterium]
MHTKQELDKRLAQAGIQPLKKLGQNFLLNPKICTALIDEVKSCNPQSVLELGPGMGALTDELLPGPWKTTLVELDAGMVKYWHAKFPELEIIHKDALKIDWQTLELLKPSVIVSNLPYSVAASLVVELSSLNEMVFQDMILMFQKEVAERIAADFHADDYGMLSVMAQTAWNITKVIDAGPQDFFPVPNVGSRVLRFTWKQPSFDREKFLKFIKACFAQRRKKLSTNLSSWYPKEKIKAVYDSMGLSTDTRAQELDIARFTDLFKALSE